MQTLGSVLDPERLRASAAQERTELADAIQAAGGPEQWWRNSGLGEPPAGLTLEAILTETAGFWRWAVDRAAQCARCPPEGAVCSAVAEIHSGRRLAWQEPGRPVAERCPRWVEWFHRSWLKRSGVEPRSVHYSLEGFITAKPVIIQKVERFASRALASPTADDWLVLSGPHGSGKTHLAVSLLREIKIRRTGKRCWYANLYLLPRQLKAFYNNEQHIDPMDHVREFDVVVLENVSAKQPIWLREALEEALLVRWNEQRSTVITTLDSAMKLAETFPALTGFQQKIDEIMLPKYGG